MKPRHVFWRDHDRFMISLNKVKLFLKCLNPVYSYLEISRLRMEKEVEIGRYLRLLKAFTEETAVRKQFQRELDRAQEIVTKQENELNQIRE